MISFFVQFVRPDYAYPALSFLLLGALLQLGQLPVPVDADIQRDAPGSRLPPPQRLSAGAASAAGALFLGFAVKLSLSGV